MKKVLLYLGISVSLLLECHASDEAQDTYNLHRYLLANYYEFSNNLQRAHELYEDMLKKPGNLYAQKGYIHLLAKANKHQDVISHITQIAQQHTDFLKNDPDTQLLHATALKKVGRQQEADELLISLSRTFITNPEITFHAVETFLQRKEPENALHALDAFLNNATNKPNNYVFHFLKGQVLAQLGKFQDALKSLDESLKAYPQFDKGWLLYAIIQEQMGEVKNSIAGYTSYLQHTTQPNQQIEHHLMQLVLLQKNTEDATSRIAIPPTNAERALELVHKKEYTQALELVNSTLGQKPHDTQTRLLKIRILTHLHRIDDAIKHISTWIKQKPRESTWYQALHLMAQVGVEPNKIITAFNTLHTQHPTNLLPILYLADLYTRTTNTDAALTYLRKGLSVTKDVLLQAQLYYQIGSIYYDRKQYSELEHMLTAALAGRVCYPPVYNLAAYYYATKGNNKQRAEQLITAALALDPHNPHFLDTQAVIYYKQKEYQKAHVLLTQIMQQAPADSMIKIHLAKVTYQLGNVPKALITLKDAQQLARSGYEKQASEKLWKKWQEARDIATT
jgi:predicted Zn-dependent protease